MPQSSSSAPLDTTVEAPPADAVVILLVDDESSVRTLLALALRREGYFVREAANGSEGLQVAATLERLDLVVTDIAMPVMEGREFAERLRQLRPDMKFIFVSGFLPPTDLGPNAHALAKPFLRQDLIGKVRAVVGPPTAG